MEWKCTVWVRLTRMFTEILQDLNLNTQELFPVISWEVEEKKKKKLSWDYFKYKLSSSKWYELSSHCWRLYKCCKYAFILPYYTKRPASLILLGLRYSFLFFLVKLIQTAEKKSKEMDFDSREYLWGFFSNRICRLLIQC